MKQLSSFSIETDQMVNLIFADGTTYRVKKSDLASLLSTPDLKQVLAGFKTRYKFLNETLPPWARAITIAVIAISVGAGSMRAYSFWVAHSAGTPHKQMASAPTPQAHTSSQVLGVSTSHTAPVPSSPAPTPLPSSQAVGSSTSAAVIVKTAPAAKAVPIPSTALSVSVPNPVSTVQQVTDTAVKTVAGTLHKLGL